MRYSAPMAHHTKSTVCVPYRWVGNSSFVGQTSDIQVSIRMERDIPNQVDQTDVNWLIRFCYVLCYACTYLVLGSKLF